VDTLKHVLAFAPPQHEKLRHTYQASWIHTQAVKGWSKDTAGPLGAAFLGRRLRRRWSKNTAICGPSHRHNVQASPADVLQGWLANGLYSRKAGLGSESILWEEQPPRKTSLDLHFVFCEFM
jgi:hypothetical protein